MSTATPIASPAVIATKAGQFATSIYPDDAHRCSLVMAEYLEAALAKCPEDYREKLAVEIEESIRRRDQPEKRRYII